MGSSYFLSSKNFSRKNLLPDSIERRDFNTRAALMGAERAMLQAADRASVERRICVKRNNIEVAIEDPIDIGKESERERGGLLPKATQGEYPAWTRPQRGPSGKRLSMNGQRCPRRAAGSYQWPQGGLGTPM